MLVRLIYASRAANASDQDQLATILRQSKTRNLGLGITGLLCLSDGVFLQALEGGRAAVNALYNRIVADPRHSGVQLLCFEEIAERRFAGWSMGQVNLAQLNPALLLKYSETAALDPFALSGKVLMTLFDDLVATASIACQP